MSVEEFSRITNCCGFVAIFNGMYCEAPEILQQYNITSVSDMMNLIIRGTEPSCSWGSCSSVVIENILCCFCIKCAKNKRNSE